MNHFDLDHLDHSLIICTDSYKKAILDEFYRMKRICDVKFINKAEYLKKYCFDHDISALKYLKDEYGLSISNAREIMENLRFVEDKEYHNEKLDLLVKYKRELDEKGLLIYDPLFRNALKERKLIVSGYGELLKEEERLFEGEIMPFAYEEKKYRIAHFNDIEEEVAYLYDGIDDLLEEGVDIAHIHVLGYSRDYESYFKRFNAYYGFTVEVRNDDPLLSSKAANDLLKMIDTKDRKKIYESLKDQDDPVSRKLIGLINAYPEYDLKQIRDFLIDDLKHMKIDSDAYVNVVKCDEFFDRFEDGDHVFLIGFSDAVPALKRDTDYITDSIADLVNVSKTEEKNALIRKNARAYLSMIDDLRISYCEKSPFRQYEISNLFGSDEYELIEGDDGIHARDYDHLRYGQYLDQFCRYNTVDEKLKDLYQVFMDEDHLSYSNRFSGLNDEQLDGIGKVTLSFSSMDRFYRCAFAYYIENILSLNEYEDTFYTLAGTLCHEVLKDLYMKKDFDFEQSWEKNLKKLNKKGSAFADEKELHFISKIKEELKQDVDIIRKQRSMTGFEKIVCENGFRVDLSDQVAFKGYIDKLMYHEEKDGAYVSVVDYKTGNSIRIQKKLMPYGLGLQLPSYMYLLKNDPGFSKPIFFCGFYLQHLICGDLNYDEDKDREQIKEESMKLEGFTSDDTDRLRYNDRSIENNNSKMIKGLRFKNDGSFYGSAPVLSDGEMQGMIDNVDEKIREASKRILEGDYQIDPKQIDGKNVSCEYCPYNVLCYKRSSDLKIITTGKGDENDG